jgi:hypothetical protein
MQKDDWVNIKMFEYSFFNRLKNFFLQILMCIRECWMKIELKIIWCIPGIDEENAANVWPKINEQPLLANIF